MRTPLLSAALLAFTGLPALAQGDPLPGDTEIMTSFSVADMEALVTSGGHTLSPAGAFGPTSVRATTSEGLIFDIIGAICGTEFSQDCLGLKLQVGYFADDSIPLDRINSANLMWQPTSTWYDPTEDAEGPTLGITRYVILDHGVTLGNIRNNLTNLLAIAPQAASFVFGDDGDYLGEDW